MEKQIVEDSNNMIRKIELQQLAELKAKYEQS